jgi:hypothetical protein
MRLFGPFALRRTVLVETADHTVRLELGKGLELGIGMPKWLKCGQVYVNDEDVGALKIGPGAVALLAPASAESVGSWRFAGQLLSYIGYKEEPIAYGAVELQGRSLGELLVPRLDTFHERIWHENVHLWRRLAGDVDETACRWMLGLTALAGFCLMASQEWHEHQPRRINE